MLAWPYSTSIWNGMPFEQANFEHRNIRTYKLNWCLLAVADQRLRIKFTNLQDTARKGYCLDYLVCISYASSQISRAVSLQIRVFLVIGKISFIRLLCIETRILKDKIRQLFSSQLNYVLSYGPLFNLYTSFFINSLYHFTRYLSNIILSSKVFNYFIHIFRRCLKK